MINWAADLCNIIVGELIRKVAHVDRAFAGHQPSTHGGIVLYFVNIDILNKAHQLARVQRSPRAC